MRIQKHQEDWRAKGYKHNTPSAHELGQSRICELQYAQIQGAFLSLYEKVQSSIQNARKEEISPSSADSLPMLNIEAMLNLLSVVEKLKKKRSNLIQKGD